MSVHCSPTTNQVYRAPYDAESVIAAKRSELQVLWDEISGGGLSPSAEPQSTTAKDRTARLRQLVQELRNMDRKRPPYINKLPDDILYLVFSRSVSLFQLSAWEASRMVSLRSDKYVTQLRAWQRDCPLILSMVCGRWQAIMLSSPSLWSILMLGPDHLEPEYLQLRLYLSRDHPLTVYFIAPNEEELLALQPYAHRIQYLYGVREFNPRLHLEILHNDVALAFHHPRLGTRLHIPPSSILSLALFLVKSPLESVYHLQHLQELAIRTETIDLSLIPEDVALPCLHVLVLDGVRGMDPTNRLRCFPVQKLQVLHLRLLERISYKEFVSLQSYIYKMPSLISVKLVMRPSAQDWVEVPPSPELVSFTIQQVRLEWDSSVNTPLQFLAGIRSLERLSLTTIGNCSHLPQYCFPVNLRKLQLKMPYMGAEGAETIYLPCLEALELWVPTHYALPLLRSLVAPSLEWLDVSHLSVSYHQSNGLSLTSALSTHASQLRYLDISEDVLGGSDHVLSFSELQTLRVTANDWRFFTSLEAPQLLELTVLFTQRKKGGEDLSGNSDAPGDEVDVSGGQQDPKTHISPHMGKEIPPHLFHSLTNISFDASSQSYGIDALLDMTPSLQKILLPPAHHLSDPDKAPVDQLARKLLEQPSACPNLQDIGSPDYPTDWVSFLQMLTSRRIKSLSSSTGYPKSIHTLRFPVLPHPQITQQLEGTMSGRQLTPHYTIPPCKESCIYSQGIPGPEELKYREGQVCPMCHRGRLEKGCPFDRDEVYRPGRSCLRWEGSEDSWGIIFV